MWAEIYIVLKFDQILRSSKHKWTQKRQNNNEIYLIQSFKFGLGRQI